MKNDTELAGFEAAHQRDGVAMVKFLSWLAEAVPKGGLQRSLPPRSSANFG